MIYKINLPDISNIKVERILDLLKRKESKDIIFGSIYPDYLCWDKVKYNKHIPADMTQEEAWALVKYARNNLMFKYESVIHNEKGKNFSWLYNFPKFEQFFHEIDLDLGGNLLATKKDIDDQLRHKFIARGIMEEAIASSQLEGANTTRKAAKQMLMEGRKPKTKDERMVLNSYQAMKLVEEELKDKKFDCSERGSGYGIRSPQCFRTHFIRHETTYNILSVLLDPAHCRTKMFALLGFLHRHRPKFVT